MHSQTRQLCAEIVPTLTRDERRHLAMLFDTSGTRHTLETAVLDSLEAKGLLIPRTGIMCGKAVLTLLGFLCAEFDTGTNPCL